MEQFMTLAWAGSVQRANLYAPDTCPTDKAKAVFKAKLLEFLKMELLPNYKSKCSEEDHLANIEELVKQGNEFGQGLLGEDGYKVGIAQKFLNLALKYLWCIGQIEEPPHCPVDRIVLSKTELNGINWTDMKTVGEYQKAIEAIKLVANELSLARWELSIYNGR